MRKPPILLWLADTRGVYIPRDFATSFASRAYQVSGVNNEDWTILEAGPNHDFYWETWDMVCNYAKIKLDNTTYTIYQDGDCWLIPDGMLWDDSQECFIWPDEYDTEGNE